MRHAASGLLVVLAVLCWSCEVDDTYEFCFDELDCDVGDQCFRVTTGASDGSMCSYVCGSSAECESSFGFAGSCLALLGDGVSICYQQCIDDFDCAGTNVCLDAVDAFGAFVDRVCFPDN